MIQRCDVLFVERASPKASVHTGTHFSVSNYLLYLHSNLKCISSTKKHEYFLDQLAVIVYKEQILFFFSLNLWPFLLVKIY